MKLISDTKLDYSDVLIVPKHSTLTSRKEVDLIRTFTFKNSQDIWTGIPIIAANMDSVATFELATKLADFKLMTAIHKHYSIDELKEFFKLGLAHSNTWYTIGTKQEDFDKFNQVNVEKACIPRICIDIANGYQEVLLDRIKNIKDKLPGITIMAGNVVTPDQTEKIINAGANVVKVGIGSGSLCETRIKTGIGYPQLSAVIECSEVAHNLNAYICADGGCTTPGDVAKAFGAGADFVMLGGMLAGHNENSQNMLIVNGQEVIGVYGMSSDTAMNKFNNGVDDYKTSEGRTVHIPLKGPVENTINDILGGLRSALTYTGSHNLEEFTRNTTFIKVNNQYNRIYEK